MLRFTGRPLRKNLCFCKAGAVHSALICVISLHLWNRYRSCFLKWDYGPIWQMGRTWLCSRAQIRILAVDALNFSLPTHHVTLLKSHVKYQETSAETNLLLPGSGGGDDKLGDRDWHTHMIIYKTENKDLLHSRGISSQYSVMIYMGKESKKKEWREPSCTVGGNANWYSDSGEQYGDSFKKLRIRLPCDPAIPLPGITLEKSIMEKDTSTL